MSRIVRSVEFRKAILGFVLVSFSAIGLRAYEAVRFDDCQATCGPCIVWANGCLSCDAGGDANGCYAEGTGCSSVNCSCGGDSNWECSTYEY